jgi:hypothetical protein
MPYGQEIIQNQDLAQAMANQQMLQQRQQASQGLMQTNGSAGWAGILGAALGGYMNKKKGDQLAQGDADISRQIQAIQEAEKQRIEQVAQEKEKGKYNQAYDAAFNMLGDKSKAHAVAIGQAKLTDFIEEKQKPTELMRNLSDPTSRAYLEAGQNKSGVTVNNQLGGNKPTPFEEKLAGKNADDFSTWRNEAYSANETLAGINQLKELSQMQATGKTEELLAKAGQWLGNDAGANMQAFNSVASTLVLAQAEKLKGAMSDGDIRLLESTMPNFGNDPRANEIIYGILERASNRAIQRYQGAEKHFKENRNLMGYSPEFNFSRGTQDPKKQAQAQESKEINGTTYIKINGKWFEQ